MTREEIITLMLRGHNNYCVHLTRGEPLLSLEQAEEVTYLIRSASTIIRYGYDEWHRVGNQIEQGIMEDCLSELVELQKDVDCVKGLRYLWETTIAEDLDQHSEEWKDGLRHAIGWLDMVYWIGVPK